jgi:hypothetical protein
LPEMFELQETVAEPDPVKLIGLIVPHVSPEGTVAVRLTCPAKWFTADTVMVEFAAIPALTGAGEATVIVKSRNWKRAGTE